VDGLGNGVVYLADSGKNKIRAVTLAAWVPQAVTTLAGIGTAGAADGGTGVGSFNYPIGICLDPSGNTLYVADADNDSVRSIDVTGQLTTGGMVATLTTGFSDPLDVVVGPGGNIYVADSGHQVIQSVTPNGLTTTVVAGTLSAAGSNDGTSGANAKFSNPTHVATDGVNLYVSDSGNNTIREITSSDVFATTAANNSVTTLAGYPETPGRADGTGGAASFFNPCNAVIGPVSGNLYVADRANSLIRSVTPGGVVNLFAGTLGSTGSGDGSAVGGATFKYPVGVAVDAAENVYVADTANNAIRFISGGTVTTLTISGESLIAPSALCVDQNGAIYVSNAGNSDITKLTPADPTNPASTTWTATSFAGTPGTQGWSPDGPGASALFNGPSSMVYDGSSTIYVADTLNNNIRSIDLAGNVKTIAGSQTVNPAAGSADGIGSAARFNNPMALALDATHTYLYVADTNNATVRRIKLSTQEVVTLIGTTVVPNLQTSTGVLPAAAIGQGLALDATHLYLITNDAVLTSPY
jgi:sugar lactone lactonase YvrE